MLEAYIYGKITVRKTFACWNHQNSFKYSMFTSEDLLYCRARKWCSKPAKKWLWRRRLHRTDFKKCNLY